MAKSQRQVAADGIEARRQQNAPLRGRDSQNRWRHPSPYDVSSGEDSDGDENTSGLRRKLVEGSREILRAIKSRRLNNVRSIWDRQRETISDLVSDQDRLLQVCCQFALL